MQYVGRRIKSDRDTRDVGVNGRKGIEMGVREVL